MKMKTIPKENEKFTQEFSKNGETIVIDMEVNRWILQKKRNVRGAYEFILTFDTNCTDGIFEKLKALRKEKDGSGDHSTPPPINITEAIESLEKK